MIDRGLFRLHGLCWRHICRPGDGIDGTDHRRRRRDQRSDDEQAGSNAVIQKRQAVVFDIQFTQTLSQPGARRKADEQAGTDNHPHVSQVMQGDGEITVAERFQGRDLFPLGIDHAADDDVQQKSGDAEKNRGEDGCHLFQIIEIALQETVGCLPAAFKGVQPPVVLQQRIQGIHDVACIGAVTQR